jgi:hypothetical protein
MAALITQAHTDPAFAAEYHQRFFEPRRDQARMVFPPGRRARRDPTRHRYRRRPRPDLRPALPPVATGPRPTQRPVHQASHRHGPTRHPASTERRLANATVSSWPVTGGRKNLPWAPAFLHHRSLLHYGSSSKIDVAHQHHEQSVSYGSIPANAERCWNQTLPRTGLFRCRRIDQRGSSQRHGWDEVDELADCRCPDRSGVRPTLATIPPGG